MSASYDKNQKVAFVYSNLYQLYKKGKDAAEKSEPEALIRRGLETGLVLKSQEAAPGLKVSPQVSEYEPATFLRPASKPEAVPAPKPQVLKNIQTGQNEALQSLRKNLDHLNQLHSRLRFMLQELEDLIK